MIYLSGCVQAAILDEPHFGFMLTPYIGNRLPKGAIWAADTGCYKHPNFHLGRYLKWLDRKGPRQSCLFATAPDVPYKSAETLQRSLPILPILRAQGWRSALVAQNGLVSSDVPWRLIDCIFIGGDDAWKESYAASELIQEALRRGKQAHVGRVNEPDRLRFAVRSGATSVDGSKLAYGFDANWPELREWMRCLNNQQSFSFLAA